MKFRKTAASILAATMAVSALSVSAFAEEEKIGLITAEIPAEFETSMVFFDGVGVVDITGAGYDSSENGGADNDANLDVNFDGLGYVSEKNLEAWRENGVLTFSKLKTNFDTTGLQWGMFDAKNGYVQLVRKDGDVVTERAVYKITDDELKKVYDLDTSWAVTREDGISVGLETVYEPLHISYNGGSYYDAEAVAELKLTVTQPDGTKSTQIIAKSNITDRNIDYVDYKADDARSNEYYIMNTTFAVRTSGDCLCTVASQTRSLGDELEYEMSDGVEVKQYYMGGTEKTIFEGKLEGDLEFVKDYGDNVVWRMVVAGAKGSSDYSYFYDAKTGETKCVRTSGLRDYTGEGAPTESVIHSFSDKIIIEGTVEDFSGEVLEFYTGYFIFNDAEDLNKYLESSRGGYIKECYTKITDCEDNVYLFEKYYDEVGYMDGDENILAEFDDAEAFSGSYAPVVKEGKAYLVDKKMNVVSEKIDADSVVAVSDNIFIVNKGDKKYFVTYKGGEANNTPATSAVLVDYSDDASGIKASANEGVVADGAKLSVAAVADKTDDNNFTYEISFKKDDKEVQPNGSVTVKIPVPEAIKDKTIYVYRVEDGVYYDMGAKIENGFVVFTTNHFSEYLVTTEKRKDAKNPATGIPGTALAIAAIAFAGAGMIVSRKKRR